MSVFLEDRSVLAGPPPIPSGITDTIRFELESNAYYKRLKNISFLILDIIGIFLVIGLLWITVDWVKIIVTSIAIATSLLLIFILGYIF